MQQIHTDKLQQNLTTWFMRRTNDSAVRRVGELPIAVGTDKGRVRSENQDRVGVLRAQDDQGRTFIVGALCDGMGGMAAGEECASLAIASFLISCYHNRNIAIGERLLKSARIANDVVFSQHTARGGATLSAFIIDGFGSFTGVNVGDSRIYSINHEINQLTVDDTIAGQLDANSTNGSYGRNELLQFIGMGRDIQPHLIEFPKTSKDSLILLTSDGIHFLPKEVMKTISQHANEPAVTIKRLLELSKWCGGTDNGSIVATRQTFASASQAELINSSNTRRIEIWDAFGEIQLIDFKTATQDSPNKIAASPKPSFAPENKTYTSSKPAIKQLKTIKKEKPSKIKLLKVIGSKPKRSKQKNLQLGDTPPDDALSSKPTPPQLIVEFKKHEKD